MKTTLIVGCFDPIHEGHIDHILKAARLGDYLYVICHKDNMVTQKKGYCVQPYDLRRQVIWGIMSLNSIKGTVLYAKEDDTGKYTDGIGQTIRALKPNIFAKGGDRVEGSLPQDEIDACKEVGCEIVYGIGDLLNSSSKMMEKARGEYSENPSL